jgi:hypothetical protein
MRRPTLALVCLVAAPALAPAASPNPDDLVPTPEVQVKCRGLVRLLGSEGFDEREEAQKQLAALGRTARPALLAGANTSPDPEVRARCAQLLPKATALDVQAKLETFLADTDGRYEHDLPAWKAFRSTVCDEWSFYGHTVWADRSLERTARKVFVELISAPTNRRLMLGVDGSRLELTDLVVARKMEFFARRDTIGGLEDRREPTLEEVAALLFADSRVGSQYIPRRGGNITYYLTSSGFLSSARGRDEKGKVYRAIAAAWLDSRDEPREMYSLMNLAAGLELNEQYCGLCARLLAMPGANSLYRARGAANLVAAGSKRHIALLEKSALTSQVVAASARPLPGDPATYDIQVRDIALGVALLLSGQKPAEYGFADRDAPFSDEAQHYSTTRYYFTDDAARTKAFAKWAEWRRTHPNG